MHTAPVADDDAAYLSRIVAELRQLSDDEYTDGPAVLLSAFARHSYVLDGAEVYWCVEWDPGLIVVRFSARDELSWAAIRSPVPNFGGRAADDDECEEYDEDAANPQYNLVFIPWDAQFDAQLRQWDLFVPADTENHSPARPRRHWLPRGRPATRAA